MILFLSSPAICRTIFCNRDFLRTLNRTGVGIAVCFGHLWTFLKMPEGASAAKTAELAF
jgi:hypothetical protein